ncbi:Uncharacterised protein [Mycobacteroides abscessus]|nr:Uncharacterised protein [Mycobacteroides abscessus]
MSRVQGSTSSTQSTTALWNRIIARWSWATTRFSSLRPSGISGAPPSSRGRSRCASSPGATSENDGPPGMTSGSVEMRPSRSFAEPGTYDASLRVVRYPRSPSNRGPLPYRESRLSAGWRPLWSERTTTHGAKTRKGTASTSPSAWSPSRPVVVSGPLVLSVMSWSMNWPQYVYTAGTCESRLRGGCPGGVTGRATIAAPSVFSAATVAAVAPFPTGRWNRGKRSASCGNR